MRIMRSKVKKKNIFELTLGYAIRKVHEVGSTELMENTC
jgi:hypothetical protein